MFILKNPPPRVIALAANKTEVTKVSVVDVEMVQSYAKEHKLIFMETSAITALNVKEIFHEVGGLKFVSIIFILSKMYTFLFFSFLAERLSYEYECISRDRDDKHTIQLNNNQNKNTKRKCC